MILGLSGERPETVDPDRAEALVADVDARKSIVLCGRRAIRFDPQSDIRFDYVTAPKRHPKRSPFARATRPGGPERGDLAVGRRRLHRSRGRRAGGGPDGRRVSLSVPQRRRIARLRGESGLEIGELVRANEMATRAGAEIDAQLDAVIGAMFASIDRGLTREGPLPGRLKVARRAKAIFDRLLANAGRNARAAHEIMDYVGVYAMAVNEENAAGGRVVTAPTNGAAGVIPAVLRYYRDHCAGATPDGLRTIILTASAIGALFKMNASISGAEVGCQGEVGVASSMAAAGLCAALGGSNAQIENAAEIAMEHHLGMTCDPVGGLVQIPCIERNAFGAVKAIAAASLALHGDGRHKVSLDSVIATMRQTGADMQSKYKETSLGGLAVNFVEC